MKYNETSRALNSSDMDIGCKNPFFIVIINKGVWISLRIS